MQFSRYIGSLCKKLMGLSGLEPPTSRLSGVRSNLLSYKPIKCPGTRLLFHAVASIVPSAACVLTIVFGMGTGISRRRIGTGALFDAPWHLNSTVQLLTFSIFLFSFQTQITKGTTIAHRRPCGAGLSTEEHDSVTEVTAFFRR